MKHILFLWPGRDVLEFFFAKSEKLMTSAITIYPYHNLKASLSTTIGPGTFQPPGSELREFAAKGFWLSDLFWNICPDRFSQIWVEVEGNPSKHQCSYKKAPLDRWLNSYCTRHRCSDGCFIFPGMSINAAMPHELRVNLLNGDAFILDMTSIETVEQLKWILREKFCDDPIEQKILKVDVLKDSDLLKDGQTLNESGLHTEPEVTVIYGRNEVEAAAQHDVHTEEFCHVNIPQTVMRVDDRAFQYCHPLVKVTIPDSVTEIGSSAFEACTSLESITIPDSVTLIHRSAFKGCTSLESIIIPALVTAIHRSAFEGCTSLESIIIPALVTAIHRSAFEGCTSLESIIIPASVTAIHRSAFEGCTSLESITIPDGVTSIEDCAFRDCTFLQSITIPHGVTSIGDGAFGDCTFLQSIIIPASVTAIHRSAFEGCTSLESITILDGVTSIEDCAFKGCTSLKSITIPHGVTSIGDGAFRDCTSLKCITIPDSVTIIGEGAFRDCTSLESVTIPDSVTIIADGAFEGCTCLERITIPKSVTLIGDGPFDRCSSLKTVIILSSTYKSQHFLEGCEANLLYHWRTLFRKRVKECRGFPGWKNESWLAQPTHLHLRRWWSSPEWSTVLYDTVFGSLTIMAPIADPPGLLWHLQMEGFERPFQVKILSPASLKTWGGIFSLSLDRYGWKILGDLYQGSFGLWCWDSWGG